MSVNSNVYSKCFLVVALTAMAVSPVSCSSTNAASVKQEEVRPVKSFIEAVPDDSLYVVWSNGPTPRALTQSMMRAFVSRFRCDPGNHLSIPKFLHVVATELDGVLFNGRKTPNFAELSKVGLSLGPNVVAYTVDAIPVFRMELAEPDVFAKFLGNIEAKMPGEIKHGKTNWVTWSQLDVTSLPYHLVYAVVGPELVVSILPKGKEEKKQDTKLSRIFGLDQGIQSKEVSKRIAEGASDLKTNHFIAYLNAKELTKANASLNVLLALLSNDTVDILHKLCVLGQTWKYYLKQPYLFYGIGSDDDYVSLRTGWHLSALMLDLFQKARTQTPQTLDSMMQTPNSVLGIQVNVRLASLLLELLTNNIDRNDAVYEVCGGDSGFNISEFQWLSSFSGMAKGYLSQLENIDILLLNRREEAAKKRIFDMGGYIGLRFQSLSKAMGLFKILSMVGGFGNTLNLNVPMDGKIYPLSQLNPILDLGKAPFSYYSDPNWFIVGTNSVMEESVHSLVGPKQLVDGPIAGIHLNTLELLKLISYVGLDDGVDSVLDQLITLFVGDEKQFYLKSDWNLEKDFMTGSLQVPVNLLEMVTKWSVEAEEKKTFICQEKH